MHTRREALRLLRAAPLAGVAILAASTSKAAEPLPTLAPAENEWEGLTTIYQKRNGEIHFFASHNAVKAVVQDPKRLEEWAKTIQEAPETAQFHKCTSSRS